MLIIFLIMCIDAAALILKETREEIKRVKGEEENV